MKKAWSGNVARNWFVRVALFVCLAAPLAGQTDEWKKYTNEAGNFSVLFPGEPKEVVSTPKEGPDNHNIAVDTRPIGYIVVYAFWKPQEEVNEVAFERYRDYFLDNLEACDVLSEEPPSPPVRGYFGHSYRLNCKVQGKKMILVGNLYAGKHYTYAVMAMFAPDTLLSPTIKKFLDSFTVLDASK